MQWLLLSALLVVIYLRNWGESQLLTSDIGLYVHMLVPPVV